MVDASVAAQWIFNERHSPVAKQLLAGQYHLHVPDFFLLEMDNIFWKRVQRKEITFEEARVVRSAFRRFPLQTHPFVDLLDLAYAVAHQCGLTLYDSLYVALAILLESRLVTADKKLFDGLRKSEWAKHAAWVETFDS